MFETEVERGANLLDNLRPGWADRIDEGLLNLKSIHSCVLGQEFGAFGLGKLQLGLVSHELVRNGFMLNANSRLHIEYPKLTATWLKAIRARRWTIPSTLPDVVPTAVAEIERELVFA